MTYLKKAADIIGGILAMRADGNMQIIARVQYRGAIIGKAGMVIQALRKELRGVAKAIAGVVGKFGRVGRT